MKNLALSALALVMTVPSAFGGSFWHRNDHWHRRPVVIERRGVNPIVPLILGAGVAAAISNDQHRIQDARRRDDDVARLQRWIDDDEDRIDRIRHDDTYTRREADRAIDRLEDEIDDYQRQIRDLQR